MLIAGSWVDVHNLHCFNSGNRWLNDGDGWIIGGGSVGNDADHCCAAAGSTVGVGKYTRATCRQLRALLAGDNVDCGHTHAHDKAVIAGVVVVGRDDGAQADAAAHARITQRTNSNAAGLRGHPANKCPSWRRVGGKVCRQLAVNANTVCTRAPRGGDDVVANAAVVGGINRQACWQIDVRKQRSRLTFGHGDFDVKVAFFANHQVAARGVALVGIVIGGGLIVGAVALPANINCGLCNL